MLECAPFNDVPTLSLPFLSDCFDVRDIVEFFVVSVAISVADEAAAVVDVLVDDVVSVVVGSTGKVVFRGEAIVGVVVGIDDAVSFVFKGAVVGGRAVVVVVVDLVVDVDGVSVVDVFGRLLFAS